MEIGTKIIDIIDKLKSMRSNQKEVQEIILNFQSNLQVLTQLVHSIVSKDQKQFFCALHNLEHYLRQTDQLCQDINDQCCLCRLYESKSNIKNLKKNIQFVMFNQQTLNNAISYDTNLKSEIMIQQLKKQMDQHNIQEQDHLSSSQQNQQNNATFKMVINDGQQSNNPPITTNQLQNQPSHQTIQPIQQHIAQLSKQRHNTAQKQQINDPNNESHFHQLENILSSDYIRKQDIKYPLMSIKATSREKQEMGVEKQLNMVLIGNQKVGKTQIINQYVDQIFDINHNTNYLINYNKKLVIQQDEMYDLIIWDTPGLPFYHEMNIKFSRQAQIIVLVYDQTDLSSFKRLKQQMNSYENMYSSRQLVVLLGNKYDLKGDIKVNEKMKNYLLNKYCTKMNMMMINCSALSYQSVQDAFHQIVNRFLKTRQHSI